MTLKHAFLGVMTASLLAFACNVDRSDSPNLSGYYFTGRVYDGVDGNALTDYTMTLRQAGMEDETATVAEDGTYTVGPLKPGSDFVVTISAEGYRGFFAAEAMQTGLPSTVNEQQTQYFEAYLFPTNLESPAVTFDIFGANDLTGRPSGSVRFAPQGDGASELNLGGTFLPAVSADEDQVWSNDADLKVAAVKILDLDNGVVDVEAGALVYGVAYTATVYDTEGYAYESFDFTAGLDGHQTVILNDLSIDENAGLAMISSSTDSGSFSATGSVSFTFNQPIEFAPTTPDYYVKEILDDGITTNAITDGDDVPCVLTGDLWRADISENKQVSDDNNWEADDPNTSERGTTISISGNTLTISWPEDGRLAAFETAVDGSNAECLVDDLTEITYPLAGITLRPAGATTMSDAASVAALLCAMNGDLVCATTTVTVQLAAPTTD